MGILSRFKVPCFELIIQNPVEIKCLFLYKYEA
jgi:hypothetical protein